MRKNLTNGLSILYISADILFCLFSIGLFVYSLFLGKIRLIGLSAIYLGFNYFFFFRKIGKFKEITFDEDSIYFDQKAIGYKDITMIKFGKIEFSDAIEENYIRFAAIPVFNNLDILIENHKNSQIDGIV